MKELVAACALAACAGAFAGWSAAAEEAPAYQFTTDWVSQNEEVWSRALAPFAGKPGVRALEVGSFEGRSAVWFLEHVLQGEGSSITCIDPFVAEGSEQRFLHNVRAAGAAERVELIVGYSERELRKLPLASYDFAYIDGCHRAVCVITDAVLTWDLLKPGGVLIFDDYGFMPKEGPRWTPKLAIDAFLEIFGARLRVVHKDYQVIVVKTPGGS